MGASVIGWLCLNSACTECDPFTHLYDLFVLGPVQYVLRKLTVVFCRLGGEQSFRWEMIGFDAPLLGYVLITVLTYT